MAAGAAIDDLLLISIPDIGGPGERETVKVVRVDKQGDIALPLITPLHAAGLTEIELVQAIVEAYRKAGICENAQVSISD
jgi:protein involved in polysaccharide export with SLBB domain